MKEAARLAREKSQDGGELTSPALGLSTHQVSTPCPKPAQPYEGSGGAGDACSCVVMCCCSDQMLTNCGKDHGGGVWVPWSMSGGMWPSFGSGKKTRKPAQMAESNLKLRWLRGGVKDCSQAVFTV